MYGKIPVSDNLPSEEDIAVKIGKRLGIPNTSIVNSLCVAAAHEAMELFMEYTRPSSNHATIFAKGRKVRMRGNYNCPKCNTEGLQIEHKFCSNCGAKLNWIT